MQTRLWVERLEIRTLLTSLSLVPHPIKAEVSGRLTLNDINGDSRADFLTIEDDRIAIYESRLTPDGGIELSQQPFDDAPIGRIQAIKLADLDEDGDLDLLATDRPDGFEAAGELVWFENLDGAGQFSDRREIATSNWFWLGQIEVADMNDDGHLDVLLGTGGGLGGGSLSWYPNLGDEAFGEAIEVDTSETISHVVPEDIDLDGDIDLYVVYSSDFNFNLVTWYENQGDGKQFTQNDIHTSFDFPAGAGLADVDGDGDSDSLLAISGFDGNILGWSENVDGKGEFAAWEKLVSDVWLDGLVDMDLDGDIDLIVRAETGSSILLNDGTGSFSDGPSIENGFAQIQLADLDGDSDVDIVSLGPQTEWYENRRTGSLVGDLNGDGRVTFPDFLILSANFGRTEGVTLADGDLDGDGMVAFSDFLLLSANFGV